MAVYYNELDPFCVRWLHNLMAAHLIADGDVDTRSIEDVIPSDLKGYTQCHFFAGIGVWSYALRLAHWPDSKSVWTGSCPCQPFSAAGKGKGFADERHLWPAFFHLIQHGKRPNIPIFGEQVASKNGLAWLDLVQADLEAAGYTLRAVDLCAAGFGAPHIRQRLYWLGTPNQSRLERWARESERTDQCAARASSVAGELAEPDISRCPPRESPSSTTRQGDSFRSACSNDLHDVWHQTHGFWGDPDWCFCRDGAWRPIESGTFPLANGIAEQMGRLRGYGNALVAPVAAAFIECCMADL